MKVFRKIRFDLLKNQKSIKYLKYAVGEIILVVFGILIALQINNWNNYKKERIIERETLANLQLDLQAASDQLNAKIRQNRKFFQCDSILIKIIHEKKTISIDSLESLVLCHLITPTFDPEVGTLTEIINTGKLNIINNSDLRSHISTWNRYIENLNETTEKLKHFDINVKTPLYETKIPMINWFSYWYEDWAKFYPKSNFSWNPEELVYTLEFENMLANYIIFSGTQRYRLLEMKQKIDEMVQLIDKELSLEG